MIKQNITNPFVGLRSFEADEYNLFFGRDTQIKDIIDNLSQTNFAAVIGYSGSGKSSLIKSGVIPALKNKSSEKENNSWKIGICTPGYDPIRSLSKMLIDFYPSDKNSKSTLDEITDLLSEKGNSIDDAIYKINKKHTGNCLLIIDQFEEIFNLSREENFDKCKHFVNLILDTLNTQESSINIILTLRSDFIGNCTEFSGLPEALNKSQYLIPRLSKTQFEDVINGPLNEVSYSISESLLQTLTKDIDNNQDQLPILQHAMMRTIEYWRLESTTNEVIDVHHYRSIGTMKKALSNHADEAYEELNDAEKEGCNKMFKVLANFQNLKVTRNPIKFSDLVSITAVDSQTLINVINTFRRSDRSFLSPKEGVEITDDTIIDISHESLLRLWSRLRVWIKEEMESSEIYKNLCETAALYQEGRGSLLINPELEIVLKWRENQNPTEEWGLRYDHSFLRAINFLEDSKDKFDQDTIFKNLAQTKRIKRNKQFTTFISVACILCLFLVVFSWIEKQKAEDANEFATEKSIEAEENKVEALIAKDSALASKNIAVENANIADIARKSAEEARNLATNKSEEAERSRVLALIAKDAAEVSRNEAEKSAESEKIAAENARKASVRAKKEEAEAKRLKNLSDAIKMAFQSEKSFDLKLNEKGITEAINSYQLYESNKLGLGRDNQIYNALNRALFEGKNYKAGFHKHNVGLKKLEKSTTRNVFALLDNAKTVTLLTENSNRIVPMQTKAYSNVSDVSFSKNGNLLLLKSSGELQLYSANNLSNVSRSFNYESAINSMQSFVIGGVDYVIASETSKSHLINLVTNEELDSSELDNLNASKIIMSNDGTYLAAFQNNEISIYSVSVSSSKLSLDAIGAVGSSNGVSVLRFINSSLVATGSKRGEVNIYKISSSKNITFLNKITRHKNVKISDIELYQDSNQKLIITSSFDNTINITNLNNLEDFITLKGHSGWVKDLYFDPIQKKIYSVSQDSFLRFWLMDSNDILKLLLN